MIEGRVNDAFEAVVRLTIRTPSGRMHEVDAVIDTGFNGFMTLPPALASELKLPFVNRGWASLADGSEVQFNVYNVFVEWDGRQRYIIVDATGNKPLVGMSLLHGHRLVVDVVEGGRVEIEPHD